MRAMMMMNAVTHDQCIPYFRIYKIIDLVIQIEIYIHLHSIDFQNRKTHIEFKCVLSNCLVIDLSQFDSYVFHKNCRTEILLTARHSTVNNNNVNDERVTHTSNGSHMKLRIDSFFVFPVAVFGTHVT